MTIQQISSYDIFRWPDGTTCYRHEHRAGEMDHRSDDFEVLPYQSEAWRLAEQEQV